MPNYTYRREDGTEFDYLQKFSDDPLTECPTTGQKVTRIIGTPHAVLKGDGFHVNDYPKVPYDEQPLRKHG